MVFYYTLNTSMAYIDSWYWSGGSASAVDSTWKKALFTPCNFQSGARGRKWWLHQIDLFIITFWHKTSGRAPSNSIPLDRAGFFRRSASGEVHRVAQQHGSAHKNTFRFVSRFDVNVNSREPYSSMRFRFYFFFCRPRFGCVWRVLLPYAMPSEIVDSILPIKCQCYIVSGKHRAERTKRTALFFTLEEVFGHIFVALQ